MKRLTIRWQLVIYDLVIFLLVDLLLLVGYKGGGNLSQLDVICQAALSIACIFILRVFGGIYQQVWRYGGIQCYIYLLFVDGFAFIINFCFARALPINKVSFSTMLSIACLNLLCCLAMRMIYRYAFKCGNTITKRGKFLNLLLRIFAGKRIMHEQRNDPRKTKIAIIGAGALGVALAEELSLSHDSTYIPACFVDVDNSKTGRVIHDIRVYQENEDIFNLLRENEIHEVVFTLPGMDEPKKKQLCNRYLDEGFKIKMYDFPAIETANKKRQLRDFDIEELLFRKTVSVNDEKVTNYYKDKVVLITGGGGSIGSELCRQICKMHPKQIIALDIYENGVYDVQQEIKFANKLNPVNFVVEIASITNKKAMERVFAAYHPQIVINAAAHKHVPLMEHNCIEAVENNVFGTLNIVELCEQYGAERFMMVSTDKAVNPTNVMGATKRMCEMIVQSASTFGKVKYSTTRFGNVLGSAGSVIPLFKRQIAAGGPVTLTDKRIIRYFMTIPEASQLVLHSGAMAENGELFVLDMGQPVRIYDLAQSLIKLSGVKDVEIEETGLRPGEKLYEELLVNTQVLEKTENSLIFIEKDEQLCWSEINDKLSLLKSACELGDDMAVKKALRQAVPTFKTPEEVNADAENSREMKEKREVEALT